MRALLKVWLFLLAGAGIGVILSQDSGYVLLAFGRYTVEMSLALLLLLLAVLFVLLYLSIRLVVRTFHLPDDVRDCKVHTNAVTATSGWRTRPCRRRMSRSV